MINQKKIAGEKACEWIKDGMVVGLGTAVQSITRLKSLEKW